MNRELVAASITGSLGTLCLAFGILGYLNPQLSLMPMLANSSMALGAISIGAILMTIEVKRAAHAGYELLVSAAAGVDLGDEEQPPPPKSRAIARLFGW